MCALLSRAVSQRVGSYICDVSVCILCVLAGALALTAKCWHVCDVMREKLRKEHSECLELISQYNSQISRRSALL